MNAIEERLKNLRELQTVAKLNAKDNRLYLLDLKASIDYCEMQLDKFALHNGSK